MERSASHNFFEKKVTGLVPPHFSKKSGEGFTLPNFSKRNLGGFTHLSFPKENFGGFTLIELLVAVGILAVLSAAIIITLNPAELLKQARDSKRLSEIATLRKALGVVSLELPASAFGTPNTIYISVPDDDDGDLPPNDCSGIIGMPPPPPGFQYHCVISADLTRVNGAGWIPVNFASLPSGSPISALPIDPVNTISSGFYYAYVPGGSYVISASLESLKRLQDTARNDGGDDPSRIEVGTNISLWKQASGLLAYWKFDEGVLPAKDSSGNGHDGTTLGGSTAFQPGHIGNAISFSPGYVGITGIGQSSLFATNMITMAAWININSTLTPGTLYGDFSSASTVEYSFEISTGGTAVDFHTNHQGATPNNRSTPITGVYPSGFPLGTWIHLAVTWDGNTDGDNLKIYIDGALAVTNNLYGIMPSPSDSLYRIGMRTNGDNSFRGKIDELRIYNRALLAGEIWALYDSTKGS